MDLDYNIIVESKDVEFIENKFHHESIIVSESSQVQKSKMILIYLLAIKGKNKNLLLKPKEVKELKKRKEFES